MAEKMSLKELQLIIRDSLYMALPDMYWVVAEISEIKENYAGHCYIELVEKNPDDTNVQARVKAIIWSNRYRFLRSFFENITGESLREGLKILIKVKIEYHEIYGLSLVISDIDPAFTIGEMALKRQLVIKKLEEEGVFTMNRDLDFPLVPQRIAIISSRNAAGYTDFINHLTLNNYGYVFYTALFESAMQGAETETGIIQALDRIAESSQHFDLVAIIRGGGSQTDLSWFDSYNIAFHVTQFPLPVITGIGHDKDMSVTDMVANKALKTPTAVADYIVECTAEAERSLLEMWSVIKEISKSIIEKNRNRIESFGIKLLPLSRIMLSQLRDKLSEKIIAIITIGKAYTYKSGLIPANHMSRLVSGIKSFSNAKYAGIMQICKRLKTGTLTSIEMKNRKVSGLENSLNILKPENVLRRGYTITSVNGRILKAKVGLMNDEIIDTQFSDGSVRSRVMDGMEHGARSTEHGAQKTQGLEDLK